MTHRRVAPVQPGWMKDARLRRMIAEQIRRRRAKRRREVAEFECAIRRAQRTDETTS